MKLCNLYLMTIKQMSHNIVEVCGGFLFAMCMFLILECNVKFTLYKLLSCAP